MSGIEKNSTLSGSVSSGLKSFLQKNKAAIAGILLLTGSITGHKSYISYQNDKNIRQAEESMQEHVEGLRKQSFSYVVKSGDSASMLLKQMGYSYDADTMDDFCALNPQFSNPLVYDDFGSTSSVELKVGDTIRLWGDASLLE